MNKDAAAAHRPAVQEPSRIQLPTSVSQVYRLVGNIALVSSNCSLSGSRFLDKVLNRCSSNRLTVPTNQDSALL